MSLAIGLDVSELRMGWAVCDYDTQEPLALGVEDLRRRDGGWPEKQVETAVNDVWLTVNRMGYDYEEIVLVGIEAAYHGPSIKRTIAHAGVIGMATMAASITFPAATIYPIPADSWRKALGIKGKNRAEKKALTMEWACDHLDDFCVLRSQQLIGQDEADALGIAVACARLTEKREAA